MNKHNIIRCFRCHWGYNLNNLPKPMEIELPSHIKQQKDCVYCENLGTLFPFQPNISSIDTSGCATFLEKERWEREGMEVKVSWQRR